MLNGKTPVRGGFQEHAPTYSTWVIAGCGLYGTCMHVHVHVYLDALDALPVMLGAYVCR